MLYADLCTQPSEAGPCGTYELQYYFDNEEGMCRPFYYGGCEGNGNRFATVEECKKTCSHHFTEVTEPTTEAPSTVPPVQGTFF